MRLKLIRQVETLSEPRLSSLILVVGFLFSLLPVARGSTLEAISSHQHGGDNVTGYVSGGAGFAFSPRRTVVVRSLGFGGVGLSDEPYRVFLWDANGAQLASVLISLTSPLRNGTGYQSVEPLQLRAGRKFYVTAAGAESGAWIGDVIFCSGVRQNGTFVIAPEITYVGSAASTNSVHLLPVIEGSDTTLFLGANLEYTLESSVMITTIALSGGEVRVGFDYCDRPSSGFILLEAGLPNGPWLTNSTAILRTNVSGEAYTFVTPAQGQSRFFRVQAP